VKLLEYDYKQVHAADPKATILVVGYPEIFEVTRACFLFSVNNEIALNILTGKGSSECTRPGRHRQGRGGLHHRQSLMGSAVSARRA